MNALLQTNELVEKLLANVFTEQNEEYKEFLPSENKWVFIEDNFTGELVEIRALDADQKLLKDRDGNHYQLSRYNSTDIRVLTEVDNWEQTRYF